jgi:SAM-dependent methyltransferase
MLSLQHGIGAVLGPALRSEGNRQAVRRAALRNGERFLEVGVGSGQTFVPLALKNPDGENHGVDVDPLALEHCRFRLQEAGVGSWRLERADVGSLPFPAESFDLVVCCYVLESLAESDRDRALLELQRVLRAGGRLVLVQMAGGGLRLYDLLAAHVPMLLAGSQPVSLGPHLVELGFHDVSRSLCRRLGFVSELLRAVRR